MSGVIIHNRVTNPRGRPADTSADADPLAARQALLDALAAYTDAPVQWSATEPGDTSVVWVAPGTGVGRVWSAGVGGSAEDVTTRRNLSPNTGDSLEGTRTFFGTSEMVDGAIRLVNDGTHPSSIIAPRLELAEARSVVQPETTYTLSVDLRTSHPDAPKFIRIMEYIDGSHSGDLVQSGGPQVGSEWERFSFTFQTRDGVTQVAPRFGFDTSSYDLPIGAWLEIRNILIEETEEVQPFFDGDTPEHRTDDIIYRYAWEGEPHSSPSTETALGQGWHDIVDPDVVAAGQAYADAITALAPVGWDGAGLWWSVEHDAVYVPQGTEAVPPVDGQDAPVFYTIATDSLGEFVRASTVAGGYFDGDTPERIKGERWSIFAWEGTPHASVSYETVQYLAGTPGCGFLHIDDQWVEVRKVSVGASTEYARPVVIETTLSGRRRAQVAEGPAHRDWSIRLGMADPDTLTRWEQLIDGAYGPGPFLWVDPWTSATKRPPAVGEDDYPHARQVVITGMSRVDRIANTHQQITAIPITLAEVGPAGGTI